MTRPGIHQHARQKLPLAERRAVAVERRVGFHAAGDVAKNRARQKRARVGLEVVETEDVFWNAHVLCPWGKYLILFKYFSLNVDQRYSFPFRGKVGMGVG